MVDRADATGRSAGETLSPLAGPLPSLNALDRAGSFAGRHIGPRPADTAAMLEAVGHPSARPSHDQPP